MNQSKKVKGFDASAFEAKQTKNADGVMEHGGMIMVGEPLIYEGVQILPGSFAAILGQGIWLGSCDFEKGLMDIDSSLGAPKGYTLLQHVVVADCAAADRASLLRVVLNFLDEYPACLLANHALSSSSSQSSSSLLLWLWLCLWLWLWLWL